MLEIGNGPMATEFDVEPYVANEEKWKEANNHKKNMLKVLWYKSEKNVKNLLHLGPKYIKEHGYKANDFVRHGVQLKDLENHRWNENDLRAFGFTWQNFVDMNVQLHHLQNAELFSMYYLIHDLKIDKHCIHDVFGVIADLEEDLNMNVDMLVKLGYTKLEIERNRELLNKSESKRYGTQKRMSCNVSKISLPLHKNNDYYHYYNQNESSRKSTPRNTYL